MTALDAAVRPVSERAAVQARVRAFRRGPRALATASRLAPLAAAIAATALSAFVYAGAFPPHSRPIAAWIGLAPLFAACALLSPARAALAGLAWSGIVGAATAGFLPGMLAAYFGLSTGAARLLAAALVLGLHGAWIAGFAAWISWLARRGAAHPALVAAGWVACELARAGGPLGVPWSLSATSQVPWTAIVQIADLAGPWGIGFLVAAVNACVAAAIAPALRGARPRCSAAAVAALTLAALGYGHVRLGQPFAEGPPIAVAVVQAGAPTSEPALRRARLDRHLAATRSAADAGAKLIVWPETAVETYLEEATRERAAILEAAADADLVLGGPHYTAAAGSTRYHNSAYLVRDGRIAARYDKQRLVPFAEDDRLAWLTGARPAAFTPGTSDAPLPATHFRAGALLCLEAMLPDLARRAVAAGADLLVNLSNDAWFGDAAAARQQLETAALRAVESRRPLLRAASGGFSAVIDAHGRIRAQSGFDVPRVVNASVRAGRARSPYQLWGDALAWLFIAAVAVATLRALPSRTGATRHTEVP